MENKRPKNIGGHKGKVIDSSPYTQLSSHPVVTCALVAAAAGAGVLLYRNMGKKKNLANGKSAESDQNFIGSSIE